MDSAYDGYEFDKPSSNGALMRSALDGCEVDVGAAGIGCDGLPVDDRMWSYHQAMQRDHLHLRGAEARKRRQEPERRREDEIVETLLRRATGVEHRGEAERLVRDHHLDERLPALKSLARSRDVDLETVVRAMLRGELRSIVELPPTKMRK